MSFISNYPGSCSRTTGCKIKPGERIEKFAGSYRHVEGECTTVSIETVMEQAKQEYVIKPSQVVNLNMSQAVQAVKSAFHGTVEVPVEAHVPVEIPEIKAIPFKQNETPTEKLLREASELEVELAAILAVPVPVFVPEAPPAPAPVAPKAPQPNEDGPKSVEALNGPLAPLDAPTAPAKNENAQISKVVSIYMRENETLSMLHYRAKQERNMHGPNVLVFKHSHSYDGDIKGVICNQTCKELKWEDA